MRLEYFEDSAADPPRVLVLRELTPESVEGLRRAIQALVAEEGELRIEDLPGVESVAGCSLSAAVGPQDEGVARVGGLAFRCVLTRAGWERVVALLGPFMEPRVLRKDAFQYLTEAGEIEWIVSTDGMW